MGAPILLTLLVTGLIWAGVAQHLAPERKTAVTNAEQTTSNLARAFAENITRSVESIDQTLLFIRQSYAQDPTHFDLASWARSSQFLNELTLQMSIIDRDGRFIMNQSGPTIEKIDLSDREHFRVHLPPSEDRLFISKPLLGRVSGKWSIQFSRRLVDAQGNFAGVVVISLDPYYLSRFYESVEIGAGSVTLTGFDGIIRARAPSADSLVGSPAEPALVAQMMNGPDFGSYHTTNEDGSTAVSFSYRRLRRYPLLVAVGLSSADIFRAYRHDRGEYLLAGGALTLLVLLVALMLVRQRRRLLRSQYVLQATLENIAQGIIMVDEDRTVPVINHRAIELLGLPEMFASGRLTLRDIMAAQLNANDFRPEDEELRKVAESGTFDAAQTHYERERANGTVLEIRTQFLPGGGAVRTFSDITERRHSEQALAAARDAAEAAGRARSEFLAVVTHEIRTPMNGIIGIAGLLLDMPMGETERQYVRIMRDSGNHLLQLINDILDFSKLDAGRLELEEISFDVRTVLTSAVELLSSEANAKGLELSLHVAEDVPQRAGGDPGRLRQILLNLIGNGVKFTEKGHVWIEVSTLPGGPGTTRLSVSVADTGIGIPRAAQAQLFTEFNQVDTSISRRFGGSGLGLAICRRLITRMGGSISVESVPGVGSTFSFDVALQSRRASDGARGPRPAPTLAAGIGYRILVAEDNSTNRLVVTKILERMGHRVDSVCNGLEAIEAVRTIPYDLVLMDVMMPEMDGLAATRGIRALAAPNGEIAIIGLTASALREEETACMQAGMDLFATKPITAERLAECIAQAMAHRAPAAQML
jgi:signal transduction histidine kinase/ActR/RegA family two-component response regulator